MIICARYNTSAPDASGGVGPRHDADRGNCDCDVLHGIETQIHHCVLDRRNFGGHAEVGRVGHFSAPYQAGTLMNLTMGSAEIAEDAVKAGGGRTGLISGGSSSATTSARLMRPI